MAYLLLPERSRRNLLSRPTEVDWGRRFLSWNDQCRVIVPGNRFQCAANPNKRFEFKQSYPDSTQRFQGHLLRLIADNGGSNDDRFGPVDAVETARGASQRYTQIVVVTPRNSGTNIMPVLTHMTGTGHTVNWDGNSLIAGYTGANGFNYWRSYTALTTPGAYGKRHVIVTSTDAGADLLTVAGKAGGDPLSAYSYSIVGDVSYLGDGSLGTTNSWYIGSADFTNYYQFNGDIELVATFPRTFLSQSVVEAVADDPFQILRPRVERSYFFPPTAIGGKRATFLPRRWTRQPQGRVQLKPEFENTAVFLFNDYYGTADSIQTLGVFNAKIMRQQSGSFLTSMTGSPGAYAISPHDLSNFVLSGFDVAPYKSRIQPPSQVAVLAVFRYRNHSANHQVFFQQHDRYLNQDGYRFDLRGGTTALRWWTGAGWTYNLESAGVLVEGKRYVAMGMSLPLAGNKDATIWLDGRQLAQTSFGADFTITYNLGSTRTDPALLGSRYDSGSLAAGTHPYSPVEMVVVFGANKGLSYNLAAALTQDPYQIFRPDMGRVHILPAGDSVKYQFLRKPR